MSAPCEWFARCTNDAEGWVSHPILAWVPACRRCADLAEKFLVPFPVDSDLWLCDCCMVMFENHDHSGCSAFCDTASHPAGLLGRITEDIAQNDYLERETSQWIPDVQEFSSLPCDGCGTHLAGRRNGYVIIQSTTC